MLLSVKNILLDTMKQNPNHSIDISKTELPLNNLDFLII